MCDVAQLRLFNNMFSSVHVHDLFLCNKHQVCESSRKVFFFFLLLKSNNIKAGIF